MSAVDDPEAFERFLATLPADTGRVVKALDAVIRAVDSSVVQVLWAHQRVVGYGVGVRKMSEHYCYVAVYGERVNLGFNHGARLPDPAGVLQGEGQRFRHVPVPTPADATSRHLRRLLRAALAERRAALGG